MNIYLSIFFKFLFFSQVTKTKFLEKFMFILQIYVSFIVINIFLTKNIFLFVQIKILQDVKEYPILLNSYIIS